jgi:uncharacterized membrane protein YeaQ/YmgE (transglycosylase-associated protein family)
MFIGGRDLIVWCLVGGLVGALAGRVRGRVGFGAVLGLLAGPIGWLIVLVMADARARCGECGGVVMAGARKCMHCGSAIGKTG